VKRSHRDVLDLIVRQHVPDETNLFPRISNQLEEASRARGFRAHPAVIILAVLLALGLLSGVVYAVGRSLGYIPGMGIVEQGVALRVLAEPVSIERDGITFTVTQALAATDRTIVSYEVDNLPESALARDYSEGQTPAPRCSMHNSLRLPDGTRLLPTGGQGNGWGIGFRYRETFDAIPSDVNHATLLVPCLLDTVPGIAPENWELPLVFVAAPADLTVVPVIEITPSLVPTAEGGAGATATPTGYPISIERTIELEDGYILIGSFHSIVVDDGVVTSPYIWSVRITDAAGNDVSYETAGDIDLPTGDERNSPWAFQILGKNHSWPLTITVDGLDATLPDAQSEFEFDTGTAPLVEKQWVIDRDLEIGKYTVRVLTATRTPDGYAFTFKTDLNIVSLGVDILGPEAYIPPAGGGGGGSDDGLLSAGVSYAGRIPEGKLKVVLRSVTIKIAGTWSIDWEPQEASSQAPPTASSGEAACVTDETWAEVKATSPARIPTGLPGTFMLFGPNAESSLYGVSSLELLDGSRRSIGEGSWPMISPDGTKVVYTADAGLTVLDLDRGQTAILPGTDNTDYHVVWSTDSSQIAFVRSRTNRIMSIDIDGSHQTQVRDNSAVYHGLVGWADSTHLLITEPGPDGVYVQSIDLTNGTTRNLFTISSNKADTVLSQDGEWIAFTTSRGAMIGNGLYVSRLNVSERRLVAAINGRSLYFPIWSPDGRWLVLSLPDPDDSVDQMRQALVELETCQVIPLPDLGGDVYSWGW
jgi:hypothetical protein